MSSETISRSPKAFDAEGANGTQLSKTPLSGDGSMNNVRYVSDEMALSGDPPEESGRASLSSPAPAAGLDGGVGATPMNVELNGTAWQMVAGTDADEHGQVETLEHLQHLLETSPEVVGPMLMGALVRLRAALQQIPRDADAMHPITVPACDAVLLTRSVLRGLR